MSVTLDVSHDPMSWLKLLAYCKHVRVAVRVAVHVAVHVVMCCDAEWNGMECIDNEGTRCIDDNKNE